MRQTKAEVKRQRFNWLLLATEVLDKTGHGRLVRNDSGQTGKEQKRQTGQRVKNERFGCEMSFEAEQWRQIEKSDDEVLII